MFCLGLAYCWQYCQPGFAKWWVGCDLLKAAQDGNLKVVKYLVEKGAKIDEKNKDGKTPYDLATGDVKTYLEFATNT